MTEIPASSSDFFSWKLCSGNDLTELAQQLNVEPGWSLYCLDPPYACFVWCPPEIDLISASPFYYLAQFNNAQQVIYVRLDDLVELTWHLQALRNESTMLTEGNVIIIPSTGRCGSTLLSNALSHAGFASLSEPDTLTNIQAIVTSPSFVDGVGGNPTMDNLALKKLLSAVIPLICLPYAEARAVFIKTRAPFSFCQVISQVFPQTRFVYMYRECGAVARSFQAIFPADVGLLRSFFKSASYQLNSLSIPEGALLERQTNVAALDKLASAMNPQSSAFEWLSAIWFANNVRYLDDYYSGIPIRALRYEDLIKCSRELLQLLFEFLELTVPPEDMSKALACFSEDSQQGSRIASSSQNPTRKYQIKTECKSFIPQLTTLFLPHPILHAFDAILPGTLLPH